MNIKIKDAIDDSNKFIKGKYIIIAIDNAGIKVTKIRQWMREKWNVKDKRVSKNTCSS